MFHKLPTWLTPVLSVCWRQEQGGLAKWVVDISCDCPAGRTVHGLSSRSLRDGGIAPQAGLLPVLNALIVLAGEAQTFLSPQLVCSVNICLQADPMEAKLARGMEMMRPENSSLFVLLMGDRIISPNEMQPLTDYI